MNIVVVGDGKVGYTLTASLSKEGHDVTVIDNRPDTLRNTTNELDVICIEGNGVSYAVQSEAGVQKADLLIAATSADEINMLHGSQEAGREAYHSEGARSAVPAADVLP